MFSVYLLIKKAVTYRHIFTELKQIATDRGKIFSPEVIMSDFETGVIPVIKSEVSSQYYTGKYSFFYLFIFSFLYQNIMRAFFILHNQYIAKYNIWECNLIMHQMRISDSYVENLWHWH